MIEPPVGTEIGVPVYMEWWAESERDRAHVFWKQRFTLDHGVERIAGCGEIFEPRIRSIARVLRCPECERRVASHHTPESCLTGDCEWCDLSRALGLHPPYRGERF
jgi:hypothetical protein